MFNHAFNMTSKQFTVELVQQQITIADYYFSTEFQLTSWRRVQPNVKHALKSPAVLLTKNTSIN